MGGCSSKPSKSLNDQDFRQLKKQCNKNNNTLFVDDKFPANYKSLSYRHKNQDIQWLRPKEICDDPKFILEGSSRHDIHQGEIGNCWILGKIGKLFLIFLQDVTTNSRCENPDFTYILTCMAMAIPTSDTVSDDKSFNSIS